MNNKKISPIVRLNMTKSDQWFATEIMEREYVKLQGRISRRERHIKALERRITNL